MRFIRLGLAGVVLAEAWSSNEVLLGFLGVILLAQSLLNLGCCGSSGCDIDHTKSKHSSSNNSAEEITFSEVTKTMKTKVVVDNLKCGGCANSIKKGLMSFSEVSEVNVDTETDTIEVTHLDDFEKKKIKDKLYSMGYPEKGTLEGLDKIVTGAKSYVSCAIGKLSKEEEEEEEIKK
ncbi:MAG: heavy metal-associated domain-containing protein [Bacteroidota bacterium]|nr:heavy metal-associated domain-containing protein [Bacteroidota bacterium]